MRYLVVEHVSSFAEGRKNGAPISNVGTIVENHRFIARTHDTKKISTEATQRQPDKSPPEHFEGRSSGDRLYLLVHKKFYVYTLKTVMLKHFAKA